MIVTFYGVGGTGMYKWVKELNEKWEELSKEITLNEEAVKNYIVMPFLKELGFNEESCWYHYEYNCREDFVDVYIQLKGSDEGIYVETKHGDLEINSKHIEQVAKYMVASSNIQWGILTNGKKYYLINRDIMSEKSNDSGEALLDKVVLTCSLNSKSSIEQESIKYFSKKYLFENRKTLFMRDIAQFKAYKTYQDWGVYFSTLFGFFNYYCEEIEPDLQISTVVSKTYLSDIRERDFKKYLMTLKPKKKSKEKISQDIIKSKCSHITEMYHEFERRNLITINNFRETRTNILEHFMNQEIFHESTDINNYLTEDNVSRIIDEFNRSDKLQVVIRRIIFCLIAYYGFTKSQVVDFLLQPWGSIKFDKDKIEFQDVERNMNSFLKYNLEIIKKVTGRKKSILGNKGERGQSISPDIVSATFDEIKKMKNIEGGQYFTPEYTRKMLIINLFKAGFAIEEISGFVGISLNSIEKIIGKDEIAKIGLKRWNMKNRQKARHPFEELFNNL